MPPLPSTMPPRDRTAARHARPAVLLAASLLVLSGCPARRPAQSWLPPPDPPPPPPPHAAARRVPEPAGAASTPAGATATGAASAPAPVTGSGPCASLLRAEMARPETDHELRLVFTVLSPATCWVQVEDALVTLPLQPDRRASVRTRSEPRPLEPGQERTLRVPVVIPVEPACQAGGSGPQVSIQLRDGTDPSHLVRWSTVSSPPVTCLASAGGS